jgi:hypothetical protein
MKVLKMACNVKNSLHGVFDHRKLLERENSKKFILVTKKYTKKI